jgi:hypothetical protein
MRSVIVALALFSSPVLGTVFFEDRFSKGMDNWKLSNWKENDMGTWTHTSGDWFANEEEAKGIATTDDLKHHAISAKMNSPASTDVSFLFVMIIRPSSFLVFVSAHLMEIKYPTHQSITLVRALVVYRVTNHSSFNSQ